MLRLETENKNQVKEEKIEWFLIRTFCPAAGFGSNAHLSPLGFSEFG